MLVKKISVNTYKKLKGVDFDFSDGITAISGTNGTCKTSLLHLIGNSYQKVPSNCHLLTEDCMSIIRKINASVNPKIEALTREARNYSDPAKGISGVLYSVEYGEANPSLAFRKHNSSNGSIARYSLKPKYRNKKGESLPFAPVIYLSLSRLFPFGEYLNEESIKTNREILPSPHKEELFNNYSRLLRLNIDDPKSQTMGDIKTRMSFSSCREGVDSNTISAGEDNLLIMLLALQSLAYYCDSLVVPGSTDAVLLIDELDATLHPSLQNKLIDLFIDYCEKWSIQIVFTTHSLSLLEYLFNKKQSVIYLYDNIDSVHLMAEPNMHKIRMNLKGQTHKDIYLDKIIPVFSEDEEARLVINILLQSLANTSGKFNNIARTIHLVEADFGSNNLRKLFKDPIMRSSTMASICILDGDQSSELGSNIVALPGMDSPEAFLYSYCEQLYDENDDFWVSDTIVECGYGKTFFIDKIRQPIEAIEEKIISMNASGESTDGYRRKMMKSIFKSNSEFFSFVLKRWIHDQRNEKELLRFYEEFNSMFLKIASAHGIDKIAWIFGGKEDLASLYQE